MYFYEFIDIFVERKHTFFLAVILAGAAAFAFFVLQPPRYKSEVVLSITRSAIAPTTEYRYDQYYRFQADERLAETLVQYLTSTTGKQLVADRAKLGTKDYQQYVDTKLRAARFGANMVSIEYISHDRAIAQSLGDALSVTANRYVASLNEDARETAWFTVLSQGPTIQQAHLSTLQLTLVGVMGGAFLGFWGVLLHFFWEGYIAHRGRVAKTEKE